MRIRAYNEAPDKKEKRLPVWAMAVIDVLLTCCVLLVFAYFHHVRPQPGASADLVVISRPTHTPAAEDRADSLPSAGDRNDPETAAGLASEVEDVSGAENVGLSWAEKFSGHFSDTVIATDTSYSSPNISITITQRTKGEGSDLITYYVADVYVTDIKYFQTYLAKETYGTGYRKSVLDMDLASGALLAMSGDYYGNARSDSDGLVIRNGVLYRSNKTKSDLCVLYYDGTLATYSPKEFSVDDAVAGGAWQGWTFGPSLLDENGKARESFKIGPILASVNPRCGIGYYEPGHYSFVIVDGRHRGYSVGVTMPEFAQIFEELGCSVAYNLDGGASAVMTHNDKIINEPVGGGRTISDCLILVEVE